MEYEFLVDGKTRKISMEQQQGKSIFVCNGRRMVAEVVETRPGTVSLLIEGKSHLAHFARVKDRIFASTNSAQFILVRTGLEKSAAQFKDNSADIAERTIKAPMPGMVIKVNVAEGSEVAPGDALVIVEAMKMEHEMRAAFPAVVDKIYVKPGQQVDAFEPLVELRAKETAG